MIVKEVKTNPYHVIKTFILKNKEHFGIKTEDIDILKPTELPIMDRYSTGSTISKREIMDAFKVQELLKKEDFETIKKESEEIEVLEEETPAKEVSLKEIDERLMTIDDFLDQ